MGRRGPVQQKAEIKIAKGTFQEQHHKETAAEGANNTPPKNPFPTKRIAWRAFRDLCAQLERLKTLDTADLSHLIAYAEAFETRELAQRQLQKEGFVLKDSTGKFYRSPWSIVWSDAVAKLTKLGNDLGCNANARSRVVVGTNAPKQRSKKADFFGKRAE